MCAPRRAAAVVRPRGREKSADRRRRILISRLLIIRASVPRWKSPFPAYFKGFPAVSPLIPPYPAFLKYPVSPQLLLRLLSPFYFFFCINQIYSAALRGAGNSQVPMWIMLGSFVVFRQIYLYIVANYVSNEIIPIAMSYPAGWFVCSVATLIYYRFCKFDSHRLVEDV